MSLSALSLFAGAGGLDLGVESAGFSVIHTIENEPLAIETLNLNRKRFFKELPEQEPLDITTLKPQSLMRSLGIRRNELDLLVGGPPCVAFSKSGFHLDYKREGKDPRANLLQDYFRFLEAFQPKVFLMENVFGLAYRNHSAKSLDQLLVAIRSLGYSIATGVLNAADYGVPQNRQRLFLIGSRSGQMLRLPEPTNWGAHERRVRPDDAIGLKPHVTCAEAFKGLKSSPEPDESVNGRYGHLLDEIPPGRNYLHYTEHEGHPEPLFKWRSRYWTFLLKLDPSRPSSTIQGQPGPYVGPFHWDNRRLRVPELKRLQTFPDAYRFAGGRRAVQLQIGNSVPPLMAGTIAEAIRDQLDGKPIASRSKQLSLAGL